MIKIKYFLTIFVLVIAQKHSLAQVVPDNTLGLEKSKVNSIDEVNNLIEGGAIREGNLFHSFSEFNVNEGTKVNFANFEGITNIFSRVTGNDISKIFGELGVNGNANLFLVNPNGIVFGKNAMINVSGSLLATTAETVHFENGNDFSAVNPNKTLLTVNFPTGLGFGSASGPIRVSGSGNQLEVQEPFFSPVTSPTEVENGLNIFSGQTLALIGNQITFDEGIVDVPSGSIEITSIESGIVDISFSSNKLVFDYSKISQFQDIFLKNRSLLNTSGTPGGTIQVRGKDISIEENSVILNSNFGIADSGNININASGKIDLKGVNSIESLLNTSSPGIISQSLGSGKGANIIIAADDITLREFSLIDSKAFNFGNGGDINIDVDNTLTILGSPLFENLVLPIVSSINVTSFASGNPGNIQLSGANLVLREGGLVLSRSFLNGTEGNIEANFNNINLSGSFALDISQENFLGSTLGSTTNLGKGGNVTVNTAKLSITEGGRINATTSGTGEAGNIKINATESIKVEGRIRDSGENIPLNSSQITASGEVINLSLQESLDLRDQLTGASGSIILKTKKLSILNGGAINVLNEGSGDAGSLEINANSISLNNKGGISASTASGEGGNITIDSENLEALNHSEITASAGNEGNGGNITIDSDTILGIENSDITANAIGGVGGNITVNSDFIVGLEERSQLTSFSDITATSEFGIDGTVTINNPDANLGNEAVVVFRKYTPSENRRLLERACLNPSNPENRKLVYLGRGGIPEHPNNFFGDEEEVVTVERLPKNKDGDSSLWLEGDPIIDSNAVRIGADGKKYLVAEIQMEDANSRICTRNANN